MIGYYSNYEQLILFELQFSFSEQDSGSTIKIL